MRRASRRAPLGLSLSPLRSERARWRAFVAGAGLVALTAIVVAACVPRAPGIQAPLAIVPWTPHAPLRGMDLSNKTPLSQNDYLALDVLQPGSVVLFSAQNRGRGDP